MHKGYIVTIPKRGRLSLYCVDAELYACGFLLEDAKVIKDQLNIYEATDKWQIRKMSDEIKNLREKL